MTDKEQIIIDGVQFNKFGDFFIDYDFNGRFQSISSSAKEYKILKSLIEQLLRKTQECEELKNLVFNWEQINKVQEDELICYRKALEEIEKIVNEPCVADAQEDCKHCDVWCEHKDILDTISRAKGGGLNERN